MVPRIYSELTELLEGPLEPAQRDTVIELLLHVPCPLKHLNAFGLLGELRHTTKPLLLALQGGSFAAHLAEAAAYRL